MSEKRKYRQFEPDQKAEIVLAGLGGDRSVRDVCREHEVSETLFYQWRDRLLEGGKAALSTPRDRQPERAEIAELKRNRAARADCGSQDLRAGGRGGTLAGLDVSTRVSRARAVVATGRQRTTVARVADVSGQAVYRPRTRRPTAAGPGRGGAGGQAATGSWKSRRPTRSTGPGWSPRWRRVSWASRSTASRCNGLCGRTGCCSRPATATAADDLAASASGVSTSCGTWT